MLTNTVLVYELFCAAMREDCDGGVSAQLVSAA